MIRIYQFSKKIIVPVTLMICISLMLMGCGGGSNSTQGVARKDKVLIVSCDVPNLDPGVGSDQGSTTALINLYDTLVFPTIDGNVKPWLATEWQSSPDGLVWTFKLRPGVKFHNGDVLTAEDVVFSAKRLLTMGEGFAFLFVDVIKDVKAIDKYTVQFELKKTFGPFISIIPRIFVLNKNQVMENIKPGPYGDMGDYGKEWLVNHDAGSGPYVLKEVKKQEYVSASKYNDYWNGWKNKDAPEGFKLLATTEPSTLRTMMTRHQLDITDQWQSQESLKALDNIKDVKIASYIGGYMYDIMLNTQKPPTDDVNFRKALAYAFDYDTVVKQLFPGNKFAKGPISSVLQGFNPDLPKYEFNLKKAEECLAKSKYANELDKYPVDFVWNSNVPDQEKIALLLQANAEKLGIKLNIRKMPWLSYQDLIARKETTPNASIVIHDVMYDEAGAMLDSRYHSKTCGTFQQAEWLQNSEIDSAIEDALCTLDNEERYEKYKAIQEKIVDLCPTIWAYEFLEQRAYRADGTIYWPAIELTKQGKKVYSYFPYNFYFPEFKVFTNAK